MKKSFRLMNAAVMVAGLSFAFTACNPETDVITDGNNPTDTIPALVPTDSITFEDVVLDSTGYFTGSNGSVSFSSGILTCPVINMELGGFSWWTGIACSNHTNMDSIGLPNQYSVYATSGANGSEKFALIGASGAPCIFQVPVVVKSLMVNNSTYAYWALKEGKDGYGAATKFKTGDYFNVTVTGYDSLHAQTGQVVIPLAEFRNNQSYICSAWTKIDLSNLGKVSTLTFTFDSSDKFGEWLNTPTYACIDNIVYESK